MSELTDFRKEKDDFFASDPQSPLTPAQKRSFSGLVYFPENPALRLELTLQKFTSQDPVQMQTSSGEVQSYTRCGSFSFSVDGVDAELTLYLSRDSYFLPFVDSLAGQETYPAGRYLDPESLGQDRFAVDFNLASR